jgi:hypothetical protein
VTGDVIKGYNRDTAWLATGVLGAVVLAALMLAVEERQPKATEAERDLLLTANPANVASVIAKSSNANGQISLGQASSVDHGLTENSQQEIPSSQTEPVVSTVLALTPETNRDGGRAIGPKIRNVSDRSSAASRNIDVKRRLIELWHQSLATSEKPRNWTAFSHLNRGESKKAAYTAETSN